MIVTALLGEREIWCSMCYSIEDIKTMTIPIAKKYGVRSMSLFGDYASGNVSDNSDVDLYVDMGEVDITSISDSLSRRMAFVQELEEYLSCHVNVVYTGMKDEELLDYIHKAEIVLYEE